MNPAEAAAFQFFQDTARASSLEQLVASFGDCIAAHDFQRAVCIRVATPGQPVQPKLLFGWGDATGLGERYANEHLYRVDPTIQQVFSAIEPFSWDEVESPARGSEVGAMLQDLRASGARNGLTVPIHGPLGEVFAVVLISDTQAEFPAEVRQRMHVSASLFTMRGLTLMEREAEPASPGLTRREIQCVYWIAEGKSDWEIGKILDISEDTVAWHVQNAKRKLEVSRRAQLATAAWRRGVLIDESGS